MSLKPMVRITEEIDITRSRLLVPLAMAEIARDDGDREGGLAYQMETR